MAEKNNKIGQKDEQNSGASWTRVLWILGGLAFILFLFLWLYFPRMELERTSIEILSDQTKATVNYSFRDPIAPIRRLFRGESRIESTALSVLDSEPAIVSVSHDSTGLMLDAPLGTCGRAASQGRIDIRHNARNKADSLHFKVTGYRPEASLASIFETKKVMLRRKVEPKHLV